ncbi:MAG: hypothetical protein NE330_04785 [Lentisphaeraceae bacterium]|nr:hypothetical protein [Lentisphaeraceae bacterium]
MKLIYVFISMFLLSANAEELFKDTFTATEFSHRYQTKGNWTASKREMTGIFEQDFYIKNKNHGPILKYSLPGEPADCKIEVEFYATDGLDTLMFNLEGNKIHICRTIIKTSGKLKGAFSKAYKGKKGELVSMLEGFDLEEKKWYKLTMEFRGNALLLSIGDKSVNLTHSAYALQKRGLNIQFLKGTVKLRNLVVSQ